MRRFLYFIAALILGQVCLVPIANSQPPHCAQILFCLFNQEAAASDSAGIHKYSEDLIAAILPDPAFNDSSRRLTSQLADRLANAEQAARTGNGKLVPEAAVVKAFNDLMRETGAPASMLASDASVHDFRAHAASIKGFPALFTANRNGANCNPGEAAFILSLLISQNGRLSETYLDDEMNIERIAEATNTQPNQTLTSSRNFTQLTTYPNGAAKYLSTYDAKHRRHATETLFNNMAKTLGFKDGKQ